MKKFTFLLSFISVFAIAILSAQTTLTDGQTNQKTFYKTFDGPGNDVGRFVIQTSDGGYAIVGKTNSYGAGGYDAWLLKTDANGDTLWTKTYGDTLDDAGYCVRQTSDGGFIIAGFKTIPQRYTDGWVFKTDANGKLEWEHTFGGDLNGDVAAFLVSAPNHTFVVSGVSNSKSYVFKINENDTILWEHTYFSNNNSGAYSLCPLSGGGYAVVGSFQYSGGGGWYPNFFKIKESGDLSWQITLIDGGSAGFVIETADKGLVFGGSWGGQLLNVKKIGASGLEKWEYSAPAEYMTSATSAVETSDGNVVVTDNSGFASFRKLNNQGDTLWTQSVNINDEFPRFTSLQLTGDGGLIMTGYGKSSAYDHQVILVKTTGDGSMTGIHSQQESLNIVRLRQNYPNPFFTSTRLRFSLPVSDHVELYITDIQGRRVKTLLNESLSSGIHDLFWDGTDATGYSCSAGVYYATLKTKNGMLFTRKLIKTRH